jgi:hypothetical protein
MSSMRAFFFEATLFDQSHFLKRYLYCRSLANQLVLVIAGSIPEVIGLQSIKLVPIAHESPDF